MAPSPTQPQHTAMQAPVPPSPRPLPPTDELTSRMDALMALRRQMLELHARLEYLRLMLRVSRPSLPPR